MNKENRKIEEKILRAQEDSNIAEQLIQQYIPFIKSETAKFIKTFSVEEKDEYSIALFAFYECILAYKPNKGAFIKLASVAIRNRLIDYSRKEKRHEGQISLNRDISLEGESEFIENVTQEDVMERLPEKMTIQEELKLFSSELKEFGITLTDVAKDCPKQERVKEDCMEVLRYAKRRPEVMEKLVKTKKLPLQQIVQDTKVRRKTIERHRRYVMAILLAYTNGYELIREHLAGIERKEVEE